METVEVDMDTSKRAFYYMVVKMNASGRHNHAVKHILRQIEVKEQLK